MKKNRGFNSLYNQVVKNGYDFGTGSWAVATNKVQMKLNQDGKYEPRLIDRSVEISAEELRNLEETSLSTSKKNESDVAKSLFSGFSNIKYDQRIGYYLGLYIGHVSEKSYRTDGSSGGFGTWILKELLVNQYIDGVIHVKKATATNKLFEYGISKSVEEILAGSKTKYYPVEYSETINYIRKHPGRYAIVGLPSYIMELRLISEIDPVVKQSIKYTVGLVCGHQKSAKYAEFLAWQCGIKPGNLDNIDFRKKRNDAPANQYAIEVTGKVNGAQKTIVKPMSELKGGNWGEGVFKVRASDFTDDVMNETADITLGDAWLPEYTTDSKGNNILVVRNPLIKNIIEEGIKNKTVKLDKVGVETIYRSQSSHYRHTRVELSYRLLKQKRKGIWVPQKRVVPNASVSWIRRRIQDQREKICLDAPLFYRTAVEKDDLEYFVRKMHPLSRHYARLYFLKRCYNKAKRMVNIK